MKSILLLAFNLLLVFLLFLNFKVHAFVDIAALVGFHAVAGVHAIVGVHAVARVHAIAGIVLMFVDKAFCLCVRRWFKHILNYGAISVTKILFCCWTSGVLNIG
jgi:hypothetical protein